MPQYRMSRIIRTIRLWVHGRGVSVFGIGIIVASLSTLRPLLRRFNGSSTDNSYTGRGLSYAGAIPSMPRSGMFRSGARNSGIRRLSEAGDHKTWVGTGASARDLELHGKQYELEGVTPKPTGTASNIVITGGSFNVREVRLDGNEDANSETEILEDQHPGMGITIGKSFTVESVKSKP